jgi:hypothetical protein
MWLYWTAVTCPLTTYRALLETTRIRLTIVRSRRVATFMIVDPILTSWSLTRFFTNMTFISTFMLLKPSFCFSYLLFFLLFSPSGLLRCLTFCFSFFSCLYLAIHLTLPAAHCLSAQILLFRSGKSGFPVINRITVKRY